jgi:hypothetical protein
VSDTDEQQTQTEAPRTHQRSRPANDPPSKVRRAGVGDDSGDATATTAGANKMPTTDQAPWSSRDADLVWDEMNGGEHPRAISKWGKTCYDIIAYVARTENGRRTVVDTISGHEIMGGNGVTPGEALRQRVEQSHLTIAQGPVTYDVQFSWRPGAQIYGRTSLSLSSPAEIIALRRARQNQSSFVPAQTQPFPLPAQPQQPPAPTGYGAPPVQPPYSPPQPPPYGYGRPAEPPPAQQPAGLHSHDPEVSNLRAEVAGLGGAVRELMEYVRGTRRDPPSPPSPTPAAAPQTGVAGAPQPGGWPQPAPGYARGPRSEVEELREELEDIRGELAAMYRRPAGVGAAPAHAPPPAPPPPASHRLPTGEVYVPGVGWCLPIEAAAPPPRPAPAPAPAPAPVAAAPVAAPQPAVGVGAVPTDPARVLVDAVRSYARNGKALKEALNEVQEAFGSGFAGLGSSEAGEAEEPEPPAADPGPQLPFEIVAVEGAELFNHPVKYTPNKKTGKLDLEGFVMSNPGVLEEGAKLLGVAVEAVSTFAKRAAATTAGSSAVQQPALPSGVGSAPAHVVSNIPDSAQQASATPVNGAGSFPAV